MANLRIGMVGLDTSHCTAFAKLLNDPSNAFHVPGGVVTVAYPGGSPDFEMSWSRVGKFTDTLRDEYGVAIVDAIEAVAEQADAILLTSADGRVHLEQFAKLAPYGKPVFVDKPFAVSSADARRIVELAEKYGVPMISASSHRFAEPLQEALREADGGAIIGADCYGPMNIQPTQPGLFWYGIHAVEALYTILGKGCLQVTAVSNDDHELVVGLWRDGRVGTVRGNRKGNKAFGALIHREGGTRHIDTKAHPKPSYAGLLERVMAMFRTREANLDAEETLEIIRFIEAANESRSTGRTVRL